MSNYYSYGKEKFTCGSCKWTGLGSETKFGEMFQELVEINCPSCHNKIGLVSFPTEDEVLENGSPEDKAGVLRRRDFLKKRDATLLKDISKLPELDGKNMVFQSTETNDGYIVVAYKNKLLWKEIHGYEYYDRFIELGGLLKEKYGDKMIDLVPPEGIDLYGDALGAPKLVEAFRKNLRDPVYYAELCFKRGVAWDRQGQYDKAEESYSTAISRDPKNADAYNNRGLIYAQKGDFDKAIKDYSMATAINPKLAMAYNNLGLAHDRKGEYDKAIEAYSMAIAADPEYAGAYFNRGLSHAKKDEQNKALADFSKAIELAPKEAEFYDCRGNVYNEQANFDKAIQDYSKAIELAPDYALPHYDLGNVLEKAGKREEALRNYENYLALKPADAEMVAWALYAIACAHAVAGRVEEAFCFLTQALEKGFNKHEHIKNDKDFDRLRDDARFTELMKKHFPEDK